VWDKSGLEFIDQGFACEEGGTIWAKVTNLGDEAMAGPTDWELWFAASGPPKSGELMATGEVPALDVGQEHLVSEATVGGSGRYIYKAYQRPGHPGENALWSGAIVFDASQCGE
jgi:TasA anchoring/assembly protein